MTDWQRHKGRQFHPLHCRFDAAQGVTAKRHLVRGEDQTETLLFPLARQFGKGELVEGQ